MTNKRSLLNVKTLVPVALVVLAATAYGKSGTVSTDAKIRRSVVTRQLPPDTDAKKACVNALELREYTDRSITQVFHECRPGKWWGCECDEAVELPADEIPMPAGACSDQEWSVTQGDCTVQYGVRCDWMIDLDCMDDMDCPESDENVCECGPVITVSGGGCP